MQPTADWEIIEVAYRRLIRRYHPDVNHSPDAEEITKQLNLAREILSDPGKRAIYDRELAARTRRSSEGSTQVGSRPSSSSPPPPPPPRPHPPRPPRQSAAEIETNSMIPWLFASMVLVIVLIVLVVILAIVVNAYSYPGLKEVTREAQNSPSAEELYSQVVSSATNRASETGSYHYTLDEVASLERANQLDDGHLGATHILSWVYSTYPEYIDNRELRERSLTYAKLLHDRDLNDEWSRYEILGAALYANGHFSLGDTAFDEAIAKAEFVDQKIYFKATKARIRELHLEATK